MSGEGRAKLFGDRSAPSSLASASASGVRLAPRATVLLVDGDDAERMLMAEALSARYLVLDVGGALAAAELLGSIAAPDLIVCSVQLPDVDGCTLAARVRAHHPLARVPFIFVTREKNVTDMMRAMSAGARQCIERPVNISQLLEKVARAVVWVSRET